MENLITELFLMGLPSDQIDKIIDWYSYYNFVISEESLINFIRIFISNEKNKNIQINSSGSCIFVGLPDYITNNYSNNILWHDDYEPLYDIFIYPQNENRIKVMQLIRKIVNTQLKNTKDIIDCGGILISGVDLNSAEEYKNKFNLFGIEVEIREC